MEIPQALTFDDVMLVPAASSVLPGENDTRTRITREIELGIPLISAAMDTVTEGAWAIAMAQAGGLGVIHRNMPIDQQEAEVRKVKKFEAGMVVNPVTIHPDETLADALRLMADNRISGIPVVERGSGKLCGILTNRDVRFADDPRQPVAELMTREGLIMVVDTAHGHSARVIEAVNEIRRMSNYTQVIVGNVATAEGARAVIEAGADAVKVGIGPGSICTTRMVAGVGVPQFTAITDVVGECRQRGVPVIADGGIKFSGDLAKAIAAGADCAMLGSLFARS